MKTFDARTRERWRSWLATHHASASEVWLIFHKRHTGKPSVDYKDALDEALCYGWIDSLIKRIDDDRYARKFTPRKVESNWSSVNIQQYKALKAAGRLAAAGLARSPDGRPVVDGPRTAVLSADAERMLRADSAAWALFDRLAPSHRRAFAAFIANAKREATRMNRVEKTIQMLKAGKKPGI
jgi:uncharacterized protein YdeI (YjbR/CyaY-like superfamily)